MIDNQLTKRQIMLDAIQKKYSTSTEEYKKYLFLSGSENGKPTLAIFANRGSKPLVNYRFIDEEKKLKFASDYKNKIDKEIERQSVLNTQYLKEKEAFIEGAILYSSWGYEQTNIDFYIILSRKNDFIILQRIGSNKTFDEHDSGKCTPDVNVVLEEPIRRKISRYAHVSIDSFRSCSIYKNKPLYWSSYY